jgi:hypothetical protein
VYPPSFGGEAFMVATSKVAPVVWANRLADARNEIARLFM